MEFISFILLITMIVLLIRLSNRFSDRMDRLEAQLRRIQERSVSPTPTEVIDTKPVAVPPAPVVPKPIIHETVVHETVVREVPPAFIKKEVPKPIKHSPGFFERHPDLEKFIGENLVSKIGIGILVLAIAYFVKFAIDNNWIGPLGRVGVGLLCGGIIIGFAHFTRNSYKAFSSVLAGGGLAVFYFTIALAYHQFSLFSQTAAFIIMVVITAFAVVLSSLYNRQELAIIALIGGFATPFMVSDSDGNYLTLFIYLIVLNLGLLAIAYQKSWRLLNLLAFIFTVILFAGWFISLDINEVVVTYRNAFIFGSIFYLLFLAINIAHNVREQKKFIASDFGIILANTGLYFSLGLYCLNQMYAEAFRGVFCIALAAFNLALSYWLLGKNKVDNNILYLLIAITLTFVSLTAPIQLDGNNITLFWATETVLLYWLFQKSQIKIIQVSSMIIWCCMLVSLIMDWKIVYEDSSATLPVLINRGFVTSLFCALATFLLYHLRKKPIDANLIVPYWQFSKHVYFTAFIILLYASGFFEINHQFSNHFPLIQLNVLYLVSYTLGFILLLKLADNKQLLQHPGANTMNIILLAGLGIYILTIPQSYSIQQQMLEQHLYNSHYIMHWISALFTAIIIYQLFQVVRRSSNINKQLFTWLICAVIVIFLTIETQLFINPLVYSTSNSLYEIQRVFIKTGWPILWGCCSFAFMWLGMRYKFRALRIVSLSLFAITLFKLFVYDIRNIPIAGKIAAFFSLGVLLLVVSFMYQRLKKIIINNEQKDPL